MSQSGLNKDGGISFTRKLKVDKKRTDVPEGMFSRKPGDKVEEEIKEPVEEERIKDVEELAKAERLNAKLRKAKGIQAGGFAVNGGSIIAALFYIDSLLINPATIDNLNLINNMTGANIIGLAISSQTMIMGYKDMVQKMKDRGDESFYNVLNEELEKIGV